MWPDNKNGYSDWGLGYLDLWGLRGAPRRTRGNVYGYAGEYQKNKYSQPAGNKRRKARLKKDQRKRMRRK